jgi:hypothetical protein
VFDSHNPKLIYGFVTLTKIFKTIDDDFISKWRFPNRPGEVGGFGKTVANVWNNEDPAAFLPISELDETQQMDVLVTQQWLRVLVCQMQFRRGPPLVQYGRNSSEAQEGGNTPATKFEQHYIVDTCKTLMQVLSKANRVSLEAHGIGMVSAWQ